MNYPVADGGQRRKGARDTGESTTAGSCPGSAEEPPWRQRRQEERKGVFIHSFLLPSWRPWRHGGSPLGPTSRSGHRRQNSLFLASLAISRPPAFNRFQLAHRRIRRAAKPAEPGRVSGCPASWCIVAQVRPRLRVQRWPGRGGRRAGGRWTASERETRRPSRPRRARRRVGDRANQRAQRARLAGRRRRPPRVTAQGPARAHSSSAGGAVAAGSTLYQPTPRRAPVWVSTSSAVKPQRGEKVDGSVLPSAR
ncbi:uncharacterized protein SOCEGT47_050030 [Sorangium cellulosum]|uniref:Uncharacterized protein n=1 Tax=Sorangium cellulosum TaxID=56 RepID=A0A4P2Q505_SORCE|nr:uncharacterized protein SOCEGT47_050030 [Sorangium cellulosum]